MWYFKGIKAVWNHPLPFRLYYIYLVQFGMSTSVSSFLEEA